MVCRYQHSTLQLLPAGATVAGWVIFLPLDQRALFTAHEIFGLNRPFQPVRVLFGVIGDLTQYRRKGSTRLPIPDGPCTSRIQDHPGNIKKPLFWVRSDLVQSESFGAPFAYFKQRHRLIDAPRDVTDSMRLCFRALELFQNQVGEILGMKAISDL